MQKLLFKYCEKRKQKRGIIPLFCFLEQASSIFIDLKAEISFLLVY